MTNISPSPLHIFYGSYESGFAKYSSCQFHIAILFSCILHLTTFLGSGQVVHRLSVKTETQGKKTQENKQLDNKNHMANCIAIKT